MKKILKSVIFVALIMTTMFFKTNYNAEDPVLGLKLKCLYKSSTEKILVEFNLQDDNWKLFTNFKAKNFDTGEEYDYNGMLGHTTELRNGCPDNIQKIENRSTEVISFADPLVDFLGGDNGAESKRIGVLPFFAMQTGTYDVTFWNSLTSTNAEGLSTSTAMAEEVHQCSYSISGVGNVNVMLGLDGSVKVQVPGDRKHKVDNQSIGRFYDSMFNKLRCPASMCYEKIGWSGDDKISLFKSPTRDCGDKLTNSSASRLEHADTEVKYDTPEMAAEADAVVNRVSIGSLAQGNCFLALDSERKCGVEGEAFREAAYYITSQRGEVPYSVYADLEQDQAVFESCIKRKYSEQEIVAACEPEITEFEAATEAARESENIIVQTRLNYGSEFGSTYKLDTLTCEGILGTTLIDMLNTVFNGIKILGIVIVIVFSMLDFTKAIASSDADALKKAFTKLKTRLIVIVILLLLPVIIEYILETFEVTENVNPLCN